MSKLTAAAQRKYDAQIMRYAPQRPPGAPFAGRNPERANEGHCTYCAVLGHVTAHPDLGCGDVGCTAPHDVKTNKLIASDADVLAAVAYRWHKEDGSAGNDYPKNLVQIAIRIAASYGIQVPKLPIQESDTDLWSRVVNFSRLRKSLAALTESGQLVTGTGDEWHERFGFSTYYGPRTQSWATVQDVERWTTTERSARAAAQLAARQDEHTAEPEAQKQPSVARLRNRVERPHHHPEHAGEWHQFAAFESPLEAHLFAVAYSEWYAATGALGLIRRVTSDGAVAHYRSGVEIVVEDLDSRPKQLKQDGVA